MKSKFKLRLAFSVTVLLLSAASFVLTGCSAPIESDGESLVSASEFPEGPFSGTICLIGQSSIRLHVGDDLSVAQEAFPKPKRSFSITSVPPEFEEKYQIYGWEDPSRSFAVLSQRGGVAIALDIHEEVAEGVVETLVKEATTRYGGEATAMITAGEIKYWFWEDGASRAMICVAVDSRRRKTVSQAIGYTGLMDYLRMSPAAAKTDGEKALKTLLNGKS